MTKIKISLGKLQPINRIVKENWGFPLIVWFMIFLVAASLFLSLGWVSVAELVADIAYFALVAGVVLQIISLTRNSRKEVGVNYGSS